MNYRTPDPARDLTAATLRCWPAPSKRPEAGGPDTTGHPRRPAKAARSRAASLQPALQGAGHGRPIPGRLLVTGLRRADQGRSDPGGLAADYPASDRTRPPDHGRPTLQGAVQGCSILGGLAAAGPAVGQPRPPDPGWPPRGRPLQGSAKASAAAIPCKGRPRPPVLGRPSAAGRQRRHRRAAVLRGRAFPQPGGRLSFPKSGDLRDHLRTILLADPTGGFISGAELNQIFNFEGIYRHLYTPAVIIGGIFALIAIVLSLFLNFQHLRSYNNPEQPPPSPFPLTKNPLPPPSQAHFHHCFPSRTAASTPKQPAKQSSIAVGTSKQQNPTSQPLYSQSPGTFQPPYSLGRPQSTHPALPSTLFAQFKEQKWIIGVLLMVPVYASESVSDFLHHIYITFPGS
ncbi:hypothetical protein KSP40_PGU008797 [Platanthera guangdongensis]|uniref:Uncharacterized protein n=1 Tax=Platanthera guangdongensis TaxID=2320717 RepID=A0ABR2N3U9_9ASPA